VDADRDPARPRRDVIARQRPLAALVERPVRCEGERVGGDHLPSEEVLAELHRGTETGYWPPGGYWSLVTSY